jgi:hypothetical protein
VELAQDARDDAGRLLVVAALDQRDELLAVRVLEQLRVRIPPVQAGRSG